MILGIGGVRALRALGVQPAVWHLNEGHAAFLILELLREQLGHGLPFNAALEAVAAACVFTTHTPVAAGHDAFGLELIAQYFEGFIRELGIPVERFLELARVPSAPGLFNMTRLALTGTRHVNGVSRIHGAVSARLCADQWPEVAPAGQPGGLHHQRRARADLPAPALDGLLRPRARQRVARAPARCGLLARARAGARRALLGDGAGRQEPHAGQRARTARARVRAQGRQPGAAAPRDPRSRPAAAGRADGRFCAALRDLQARDAAAARPRAPRAPGEQPGPADGAAVRRQSAPGG